MGLAITFGAGIGANFLWGPAIGAACTMVAGIIKSNNPDSNVANSLDNAGRQISKNTSLSTPIYGGNSTISNTVQNSPLIIEPKPFLSSSSSISNCNSNSNCISKKITSNNQSISLQPKASSNISKKIPNSINKAKTSLIKEERKTINKISSNNMKPATPAFNSKNIINNNIKSNKNYDSIKPNISKLNNNNNKANKNYDFIYSNINSLNNDSKYENKLKDLCFNQKNSNSTNLSLQFNNNKTVSFNNNNIIKKPDNYFYNTNSNFYNKNKNYFNNSNSNIFNDNDNYFYNTNFNFYNQRNSNNSYNNNYNNYYNYNDHFSNNSMSNLESIFSLEEELNYNFNNKKNYYSKYLNHNPFQNYNKDNFYNLKFCPKNNAELIYDKLIEEGCTKEGAAGLLGNLSCESGLKSVIYEKSKKREIGMSDQEYVNNVNSGKYKNFINDRAGFGLAQWTSRDRKLALLNHCKGDIGNVEKQLDFLIKELKTKYPRVWNSLTTSRDVKTCSDKVVMEFERPKDYSSLTVRNRRYKESLKFYNSKK